MKFSQRLQLAGKEIIKANFGNALKSLTYSQPILTTNYRGVDTNGFWLFNNTGTDIWFSYTGRNSSLTAYNKCPPVSAIVNRIAQAYINGRTWVLDETGKESKSKTADKLRTLLHKPNALQSWKQFEAQCDIYISLFGYCVLLPIKPVGFDNIDAKSIWNIPPHLLEIKESETIFYANGGASHIESITMVYKNKRYPLNPDDLWIMKDTSPSMDSVILPESRLRSQEMNINNIIGILESLNVLVNRRGALGILTSDKKDESGTVTLTPGEKADVQKDFMEYGLLKTQAQVIISNAALKWQQMGYSTKDLMLFEGIEAATMSLCDSYNYPYRLLASNNSNSLGGTDANYFNKQLYQDCIIPRAENAYEQWNIFFGLKDLNLKLDKDYSHIAVLQEDKVNNGRARLYLNQALLIEWQNNLITANEWLSMNGMDTRGPEWDVFYSDFVAQGKSFGNSIVVPINDNQNQQTANG